jgi:hypothetical protein
MLAREGRDSPLHEKHLKAGAPDREDHDIDGDAQVGQGQATTSCAFSSAARTVTLEPELNCRYSNG